MSTFVLTREKIRLFSKLTREQVLDKMLPDVDVTMVRGAVVDFSDLPPSPKYQDLPDCGHCGCCSLYLSHRCDGIRQGFCEELE